MNRAISVTDTIRVENELSQVQGQIEQIAGPAALPARPGGHVDHHRLAEQAGALRRPGQPGAIGSAFSRGWDATVSVVPA